MSKVVYRVIDPAQHRNQHVLVVGGGDSALEAATTIAEEPGTTVTLSYRSDAFSRAKPKNRKPLKTLKAGDLTNEDIGISALHNLMTKYQKDMVKKSKINPIQAMGRFLKIAKEWSFQLNPKYDNAYLLERIVKLGTNDKVRHHLNILRNQQTMEKENF